MIVHNKKDKGEKKTRSPKGREVPHVVSHFHKSFFQRCCMAPISFQPLHATYLATLKVSYFNSQ